MRDRSKLVEVTRGEPRLDVSLPDGSYRLSLADSAVELLREEIALEFGDIVPTPYVPILVARRDARFSDDRDPGEVVPKLPAHGPMSDRERDALVAYLRSTPVDPRDISLVERVVAESPVSDSVAPSELAIDPRPETESTTHDTDWEGARSGSDSSGSAGGTAAPSDVDAGSGPGGDSADDAHDGDEAGRVDDASTDDGPTGAERDVRTIPGVGDTRASKLEQDGVSSVEQVAAADPDALAEIPGISQQLGEVAVEGARELVGDEPPTAARLASETGREAGVFEPILSQLSAAGVPPSRARPVLRHLYSPSIVDIDAVGGRQAYFLWEAGYRSPGAIAAADIDELTDVRYIGAESAAAIHEDATDLLSDG